MNTNDLRGFGDASHTDSNMKELDEGGLEAAAKAVLASWDERMLGGPETYMTNDELGFSYWSPSAAMVDSEAISKLRAALAALEGQEPVAARCCSAISPCSWQRHNGMDSVCPTCIAAAPDGETK